MKNHFDTIDTAALDTVTGGINWSGAAQGAWNAVKSGAQKAWGAAKDWAQKQVPPGVIRD